MEKNFTPLNLNKFKENKEDKTGLILLIIATLTAFILAVMLFILIQKKIQHDNYNNDVSITNNQ
ncbi:MAG: hypothetical protein QHH09_04600 [Microgenomates group bacterium]|nr:hypothetical protein [Microgenomates group bacterium]